MPLSYPLINGNRFDFSSVEFTIAAILFAGGVKEVSYKDSLEPGALRGNHAQKIGRTRGQLENEGSMTLFKAEFQQLITLLGPGYMEKAFNIVVNYAETGQDVITDTLVGCRIKSAEDTGSEGGDPLAVKCELDLMYIIRNGITPIDPVRMLL